MRILIYWEQCSWGGVDTHLLELLQTWPVGEDEFLVLVNEGNLGFTRMKAQFESLSNVRCESFCSYSHNELNRRMRGTQRLSFLTPVLHFFQPLTYFFSVWRLKRALVRLGPFDVLLANNGGYPAAWGAICAVEAGAHAGIKARILLVHHAAKPPAVFMGAFERMVDMRVMRHSSAVLCVSSATRAELLRRRWIDAAAVRIRVIHNGITEKASHIGVAVANVRSLVAAREGDLLIGIVGRIEPYKGHEDLIFALARMAPQQRQGIQVVVLGTSASEDEIPRLQRIACSLGVKDHFSFPGYIEGRPVDLIAQFDLLVVATRSFEGFGLTLIEAMSVGVPVVATHVGAIPEFVHGGNGYLVYPASPRELANVLVDFKVNPVPWQQRAETAKLELRERNISMAKEYRQLFLECLA
jgi:glycosyltransferase involved in cell wall biosynthesis